MHKNKLVPIFFLFSFCGEIYGVQKMEILEYIPFNTSISITCSESENSIEKQYDWWKGNTKSIVASCFNHTCRTFGNDKYTITQTKTSCVLTIHRLVHTDSGRWNCEHREETSINLYFYPVGYQAPVADGSIHISITTTIFVLLSVILLFVIINIIVVCVKGKCKQQGNAKAQDEAQVNGLREDMQENTENKVLSIEERKAMLQSNIESNV